MENINNRQKSNDNSAKIGLRMFEITPGNKTTKTQNTSNIQNIWDNNFKSTNNSINNKTSGEITGENLKLSKLDQGMPLRSRFNPRRDDQELKSQNKYLDFNIFDEDTKPVDLNVSSFDPHSGKICDFDDIVSSSVINKSDPIESTSAIYNDFNWYMLENIRNLVSTNTFYSTYGIMNILSGLYIASKNDTETEIKNYLQLLDKSNISNGLDEINKYINKSECLDFKNIMLVDKRFKLINSGKYKNFVEIVQINSKNSNYEADNINNYLRNTYGNTLGNVIKPSNIVNMDIICLSVGLLRTVWKQPFDKVIKSTFISPTNTGTEKINVDVMCSIGKTFDYYEDNDMQILENKLFDNILTMGIILPKKYNKKIPSISISYFHSFVNKLKPTILNEVTVPKFSQQCKLRLSSIFKKSGLVNIFANLQIPDIINDNVCMTDFIQNITVIVDDKASNNSQPEKYSNITKSTSKFIANSPFIYYFRSIPTNTIILTGQFMKPAHNF